MRYPWKYVQIDGQWHISEDGHIRPATPEGLLDVLVGDEWQSGSIGPDENGKWMVRSRVSESSWELKEGQWAFYRPGPYDWVHSKRPRGKCYCEIYRFIDEDRFFEAEIGTVVMDLAHYPIRKDLWDDNGIYIKLREGYSIYIDDMRSMEELGYDEDVFFWSY